MVIAKDSRTRYFEDLEVGEVAVSAAHRMSEAQMVDFAREFDPQYFHIDADTARDSHFGGIVASGALIFAVWVKLHLSITREIVWICGLGFDDMRMPNPWRPDVPVRAHLELLEKRRSTSDARRGITRHRHTLMDDADRTIMTMIGTSLVECRDAR